MKLLKWNQNTKFEEESSIFS